MTGILSGSGYWSEFRVSPSSSESSVSTSGTSGENVTEPGQLPLWAVTLGSNPNDKHCGRCGNICTDASSEVVRVGEEYIRLCYKSVRNCWADVMLDGKPLSDGRSLPLPLPGQLIIPGMEHL